MTYVWWQLLLTIFISYMIGNITFARPISKKIMHNDITKLGSGNPGTTNMLRNFGVWIALLTLIGDIAKSFVCAFAAYQIFGGSYVMLYIAGFSAFIGHVFPVLYGFKGGKGVATIIGVFLAAAPLETLAVCFLGYFCWLITSYGSVVSVFVVAVLTIFQGIRVKQMLSSFDAKIVSIIMFLMFVLMLFFIRTNVQRLIIGKESKASLYKKTKKLLK